MLISNCRLRNDNQSALWNGGQPNERLVGSNLGAWRELNDFSKESHFKCSWRSFLLASRQFRATAKHMGATAAMRTTRDGLK